MKKPAKWKWEREPKAATAPSLTDADAAAASTVQTAEDVATSASIPRDVTARGLHSECVVCQDDEVTTALLSLRCHYILRES